MAAPQAFGKLLSEWRRLRGKSQLDLALTAEVSPRHVSFVETGRSKPTRAMVMTLASALNVPLREQNSLLLAAGFAPVYLETPLGAEELEPARRAIELILRHHEPFPAVVMSRHWDLVRVNDAARAFFAYLLDGRSPVTSPTNVLRQIFHPLGLRPRIANWEAVAAALVQRVHREAVGAYADEKLTSLLEEVLAYAGVPARLRAFDAGVAPTPLVPVVFVKDRQTFRYFSTVTTIGTAQDVTLQELRVESFFPEDEATAELARRMVSDTSSG
ncbi:MAG: helix-turn-helix transcriptional regulator [Kofleriaceae bacterium]